MLTAASLIVSASLAAPVDFVVDPDASAVLGSFTLSAETDGTLIGDYDPDTNPTGTQTRPGLFGGSGNQPIPLSLDAASITTLDLSPAGAFGLDADTSALTFTVDGLSVDLLNGQTVDSSVALTFLYETFRTFDPSFLYLGGIPLPFELDVGQLTTVTLVQSAPMAAPGVLIPLEGNQWTLAGAVPVTLTVAGTTFGDAPIDPAPAEIVLPLGGTLTLTPGGGTVEFTLDLAGLNQTFDTSDLPPLPAIPFELPTLGTETAGVILSLAVTSLGVEAAGAITLVANGTAAGCSPADLAEPFGVLDLADIQAFVTAFTGLDPAADLDGNGVYDLADIQGFVTSFTTGCP